MDKGARVTVSVVVPGNPPNDPNKSIVYSENEFINHTKSIRLATKRCMNAILTHMMLDRVK